MSKARKVSTIRWKRRRLDYVPGHYEVLEDVRFTYACENEDCQKHIVTAPKPPQAIEKGAAASGLLADIAVSKFTDHLPTYRKEEISDRHGFVIPRSTQCGWLRQTAATATVLVALAMARVLKSRAIHTDDTRVRVIVPGQPQTHEGYFWVYVGDQFNPFSVYDFTMSHSRDGPAQFLSGYEGYLQADGYGGYDGIAIRSDGKLILVSCGAHIRRRFYAQRLDAPEVACPALAYFRQLYLLERQWKPFSEEERYYRRQAQSLPILAEFRQWLDGVSLHVLPKSKIGEAVSYAKNQGEAWQRYCEAGFLSIDNNISERMAKPCTTNTKDCENFHKDWPEPAERQLALGGGPAALCSGTQGMALSRQRKRRCYRGDPVLPDRQRQGESRPSVLLRP